MSGRLTQMAIRALDSIARVLPQPRTAPHVLTGKRGEEEAYFFLRRRGCVVVARNYRTPHARGELDIVAWDDATLCFVEVKTRSSRAFLPAEAAIDSDKRSDLSRVARLFLRKIGGKPNYRFDVISVYLEPGRDPDIVLFKSAFGMA